MKKIKIYCLLWSVIASQALFAQKTGGIHFTENLNWPQLLHKARQEHKFIFVDAYATWCAPCKAMDTEIYQLSEVGEQMNNDFISVKVQMDVTSKDNASIKAFYDDAKRIQLEFKVNEFPTFLFFNDMGRLVQFESGYKPVFEFLKIIDNIKRSVDTYDSELRLYRNGVRNYDAIFDLYTKAKALGKTQLVDSLAHDYKGSYIDTLAPVQLLTTKNLIFCQERIKDFTTKDAVFKHALEKRTDSVLSKGALTFDWAGYFVNTIIAEEEVVMKIKGINHEPDWRLYVRNIQTKYPVVNAVEIVAIPKMGFFLERKNFRAYIIAQNEYNKVAPTPKKSLDIFFRYNVTAWQMFENSTDKWVLNEALKWVDKAIMLIPGIDHTQCLDTRANLLYKLGRVKEAIAQEEIALSQEKIIRRKHPIEEEKSEYYQTIQKMKAGLPTWPLK